MQSEVAVIAERLDARPWSSFSGIMIFAFEKVVEVDGRVFVFSAMPIGIVGEIKIGFAVLLFNVIDEGGKTVVVHPIIAVKDTEINAGGKF